MHAGGIDDVLFILMETDPGVPKLSQEFPTYVTPGTENIVYYVF